MFVTDYNKIAQNNDIFFSVADNVLSFREAYDQFSDMGYLYNNYFKYIMFFDSYKEKFNQIQTFIVGQSYMGYNYDRLLRKYILSSKAVQENYRFLNISKHFTNSSFEDKPVLYLAAGPSLQKNMQWLKEHKDEYIIFSVFMILPILAKEGITPDVVIHIDEQDEPIKSVLSRIDLNSYAQSSIFILAPGIDMSHFQHYDIKSRTFLLEDRTYYKINHGFLQLSSVGETGYALSLIFGAKEIYLLGLDLAFDEESGKSHIEGHSPGMSLENQSKNVSLRETYLKVKGNFRDEVVTNPLFQESIFDAQRVTQKYKRVDQKVFNLNDGAYIEGTIPLKIEDISIKKKINNINLYNDFIKNSSTLTQEEMDLFKQRYNRLIDKKRALKKFVKQEFKTQEEFMHKFIQLAIKLTINKDEKTHQLEQVLSVYLHHAGIYISEFCNTAGVHVDKKVFKKFQLLIVKQFERIIMEFQKALTDVIEPSEKS